MVAPGVGDGHAAHAAGAAVVEGAQVALEVLPQAPDHAAVEENREDQGYVDPPLDFVVDALVLEHSLEGS